MKRIILTIYCFALATIAQTISPQVLNNGSLNSRLSSGTIQISLGEAIVGDFGNIQLGFQQELSKVDAPVVVTTETLISQDVDWNALITTGFAITVSDMQGKVILKLSADLSFEKLKIQLQNLPNSPYVFASGEGKKLIRFVATNRSL